MQFGIFTVGDVTTDPTTARTPSEHERIRAMTAIALQAEEVGLDVFATGEHHIEETLSNGDLYYEDHGAGQPVVLIHGWPLNGAAWERQAAALLAAGHRVITYDRRRLGAADQPASSYGYDSFAAELDAVLTHLDLREVILVGFSSGTGEVTRHLGRYGSERVIRAVTLGVVPPFLLKAADNADSVDGVVFEEILGAIRADRHALIAGFLARV